MLKVKYAGFFLSLLLVFNGSTIAQESRTFNVVRTDDKPLEDVSLTVDYGTIAKHLVSDRNGNFKVERPESVAAITLSCIGFETQNLKPPFQDTIVMNEETINLEEVEITQRLKSRITYVMVDFNSCQVTYIPASNKDVNKIITTLKYHTIDVDGVKGLKYLPFSANIFSVDTLTDLPGLKLLLDDIIVKRSKNSKWVEVDVSKYGIQMPKEGVFISFKTLEVNFYKVKRIESRIGIIEPVPALKIRQRKNGKKSFVSFHGYPWVEQPEIYEMDIVLK